MILSDGVRLAVQIHPRAVQWGSGQSASELLEQKKQLPQTAAVKLEAPSSLERHCMCTPSHVWAALSPALALRDRMH